MYTCWRLRSASFCSQLCDQYPVFNGHALVKFLHTHYNTLQYISAHYSKFQHIPHVTTYMHTTDRLTDRLTYPSGERGNALISRVL